MGSSQKANYGARKLSRDVMAQAVRDKRVWVDVGVVRLFDGETSHFELDGEDLLVDVEIGAEAAPTLCRMATYAGGVGGGVWRVPPVGTEVLVAVPMGDYDADPVIVAVLPSGALPEGIDEQTLVIASPKVRIDAAGGDITIVAAGNVRLGALDAAHPAARGDTLQAALNAFIDLFNTHVHSGGVLVGALTGVPSVLSPESGPDALSDKVKVS